MVRPSLSFPGAFEIAVGLSLLAVGLVATFGGDHLAGIVAQARDLFLRFGVVVLFLAAFIEALPLIAFYLPLSLIIVTALIASKGSVELLLAVWAVCYVASLSGFALSWWLGRARLWRQHDAGGPQPPPRRFRFYLLSGFLGSNVMSLLMVRAGMNGEKLRLVLVPAALGYGLCSLLVYGGIHLVTETASADDGIVLIVALAFILWGSWKGLRAWLAARRARPLVHHPA